MKFQESSGAMLGAWFCVIFCCCCSSRYLCLARGFSRYLPSAAPPNLPHTACTPCSDLALQARSTTAANLECSQALACPWPSASLQDWTLCRAAAGGLVPAGTRRSAFALTDQDQGLPQKGNQKQPVRASPGPPGPHPPTFLGTGVSPGLAAREPLTRRVGCLDAP